MKKGLLLFLMLVLSAPFAFADITLTTDQHIYNLGNRIKASASLLEDANFEGLFKLTLACENYRLQYFLTPVSLEANFRMSVSVPEIVATASMLGNCTIKGDLTTNDNLVIEQKESKSFEVTNLLDVLPVKANIESLPGKFVELVGMANEAFGNNALKASIKITLDNDSYNAEVADGEFNLTLKLPDKIKSGKHSIGIIASDQKLNLGSSYVELEVAPVATELKLSISEAVLSPGSRAEFTPYLYDQAGDFMNASLDIEMESVKGSKVFAKTAQGNEKVTYELSQYLEPGMYFLKSSYGYLSAMETINITAVRDVKIKYENETVIVENIGNVPFEDELTFILESELKKYPITKKLVVGPGKILNIDLSKEVPLGNYNVLMPVKEALSPIQEKLNETLSNALESAKESVGNFLPNQDSEESVLAANVTIHDNRPAYKKIASGLSSISGALVGAEGVLAENPIIAPFILTAIVLALVFRYGRKPIMRLIKSRKGDESQNQENNKQKD